MIIVLSNIKLFRNDNDELFKDCIYVSSRYSLVYGWCICASHMVLDRRAELCDWHHVKSQQWLQLTWPADISDNRSDRIVLSQEEEDEWKMHHALCSPLPCQYCYYPYCHYFVSWYTLRRLIWISRFCPVFVYLWWLTYSVYYLVLLNVECPIVHTWVLLPTLCLISVLSGFFSDQIIVSCLWLVEFTVGMPFNDWPH